MTDFHTHLGQFYHIYTSPADLLRIMDDVGVDKFACSSTSICGRNYGKVLNEMSKLVQLAGNRVFPVLWIIPSMLHNGVLQRFLNSDIEWKMLKIHPQINPTEWQSGGCNLQYVIKLAKKMNLPLLIHTGEHPGCYPSLFERAIRNNPEVTFVLAHGRPIQETIQLMLQYKNIWTDIAFMPKDNLKQLIDNGLSNRILFGTDAPINKYFYPELNTKDFVKQHLDDLREVTDDMQFKKIISNTVFCTK